MTDPSDAERERLIKIESALMHLAHEVEQMQQAILAHERAIEALRRTIERFEGRLDEPSLPPDSAPD